MNRWACSLGVPNEAESAHRAANRTTCYGLLVPTHEVKVPDELAGARLDKAIAALVEGASRARVKAAIADGAVRVNGRYMVKGGLVAAGDVLTVELSDLSAPDSPAVPEDAPLVVRHESKHVLVVDKPAGQPSAPLRHGETGTLANALAFRFPETVGIGYSPREPGLLHRLDTDTSGLLVVARTKAAFAELKEALKGDALVKEYLLVCKEEGLPDEGTIAFPLTNHPKDQRRVYACVHPRDVIRYAPREASTDYVVLERKNGFALVRVVVSRALRHQIRAHFAAILHPLVGDKLYGGEPVPGLERHALHASRIALETATPGLGFDVSSELPAELAALLK